jgi:hypothetical protein
MPLFIPGGNLFVSIRLSTETRTQQLFKQRSCQTERPTCIL